MRCRSCPDSAAATERQPEMPIAIQTNDTSWDGCTQEDDLIMDDLPGS